jgi:hypothetical protein
MYKIIVSDIEIDVIKKNIKNLYLSVHPQDGKVKISAPKKISDDAIRTFAISKLPWINKQLSKLEKQEKQFKMEFISGENHYYQGRKYLLNVIHTNKKQKVEIRNQKYIDLYVRENATLEQRKKVLMEWYRRQLKAKIPNTIEKWEKIIGVKVDSFGIKLMKTKWGTCNIYDKRIWINLELAKKSERCLEYVVVHEMVHLLERYHNKIFYMYMDKFIPNWREIKKELNDLIN